MVEGHSVHRIASRFRQRLVGKTFSASSPNGRFVEGSRAIDGRVMSNIEAVGKNLFVFFSPPNGDGRGSDDGNDDDVVVTHIHFGMAGAWAVFNHTDEPETKATTRLRLEETGATATTSRLVAHLSAMTVDHGTMDLFETKRAALGQDPLRPDADPVVLYERVSKSKKSIGQLLMDQSYFAGPGNIYRAEILFLAGVYPTTPGLSLSRSSFDTIWETSVKLLRRGYDTGSILTVDADVDPDLARRGERRYIYNRSNCARCGGRVSSWNMSGRTCYACHGGCQPKLIGTSTTAGATTTAATTPKLNKGAKTGQRGKSTPETTPEPIAKDEDDGGKDAPRRQHVPFVSLCARESYAKRLARDGPAGLTIAEIRAHLEHHWGADSLPPKSARKDVHVQALAAALAGEGGAKKEKKKQKQKQQRRRKGSAGAFLSPPKVSAEEAAREKAAAGEHRGVEHVAELSGEQAVRAISGTPAALVKKETGEEMPIASSSSVARKPGKTVAGKRKALTKVRATRSRRRLEFD